MSVLEALSYKRGCTLHLQVQMSFTDVKYIIVILFCSTELMRRVRRFQIAQYNCLVIKYAKDTRYSEKGMATHDK